MARIIFQIYSVIFEGLYRHMNSSFSLADIQKKDEINAFKHFFESFYPSVCVFARKYLRDEAIAKDFAQESFIEYWKKKENFTDIKAIKGFIYTVTKNKCLNELKLHRVSGNSAKEEILTDEYFYDLIFEEETYAIVHHSVNTLAPQSRKIVWLSMEGKKNQEIAEQLTISVNTVKTLKKNAYKALRNQLKDQIFALAVITQFLN